ncbi:aminotransferase class I/II-fold pyridoxal phosphate-dependent enzyme [Microbacterium sp. BK668]|uniref:pyridoxal phosphate-dependent aminotransferase n=1 Tax=Microbacterium sp. BK668 TaxID=2512118 RepID=UPI00105FE240|nr:aminotransferase class I/II-fold pyridoxal phosphate-dependent enzyme [Microbacterium sp. BK668]TDN92818.1 aspartate aminotransferase [Microbacterium sp. BK668]
MPRLADHILGMPGSGVRHILEQALRLDDAIILAVGEPGEEPAPAIREAAAAAWREGHVRYGPNGGIAPLRRAIVDRLDQANGVRVDVEQVWVTVGATQALHQAMSLTLAPGDEVLVPDPGYTTFTMNAHMLAAVPVPYALSPERGFQPDLAQLEALVTDRTRLLIVNSPSNPLGSTFEPSTIQALLDFAARHDLWVLSDECYEAFTYGIPHVSPASLDADDRVFSVFSTSKTYAMTGARVGWLVTPRGFSATMLRVQESAISCVDMPAQHAALEAITGSQDHVRAAAAHYRENLVAATALLDERGLTYLAPTGAFYLWIDVSHATDGDVAAWAERFLHEHRVAVAPGSAFGRTGEGWIRVCCAARRDDLLEGLGRLPAPGA